MIKELFEHLGPAGTQTAEELLMRGDDYTDIGGTGEVFLTTHWTLIQGVVSSGEDESRALIGLLMNRYWKPIYCYLRRKGYNNEQAKDLTQGFFHEVVLERHLIENADAAKGRFRSFLLMALDRYLVNVQEMETAQKRMPKGRLVPLDMVEPPELPRSLMVSDPKDTFGYAWVTDLLERVLGQVEAKCYENGKAVHWCLFRERLLRPIIERTEPVPVPELCAQYGIEDSSKVSNMIVTVKRRFQTILKQHLRNSVISDEHVEGEIEEIQKFFPKIAQEWK
jgi:RNA polymerase sigma-70 factor (ECF subfamily)